MKYSPKRSSSLFLIELMIAFFFFTIGAAISARMFGGAWQMSQDAKNINQAQNCAANMAAALEAADDVGELPEYFPKGIRDGSRYKVFYDKEWKECMPDECRFTMEAEILTGQRKVEAHIIIKDGEEKEIYQLETVRYIPIRAARKGGSIL